MDEKQSKDVDLIICARCALLMDAADTRLEEAAIAVEGSVIVDIAKKDGRWTECPSCSETIITVKLRENLWVCPHCEYHFRIGAKERIAITCDEGSFVEMDSPAALINKYFKHIAIEFESPPGAEVDAASLRSLPGVASVVVDGGKVTLYSSDVPATMASPLGTASHSLKHMVVRQATLEDVFLKITGRSMRQ